MITMPQTIKPPVTIPVTRGVRTSVLLSHKLIAQLEQLCDIYGESQSSVLRRLVMQDYMRNFPDSLGV